VDVARVFGLDTAVVSHGYGQAMQITGEFDEIRGVAAPATDASPRRRARGLHVHPAMAEHRFDRSFVEALPADLDPSNRPRQVQRAAYSRVLPTPVSSPSLVAASAEVAAMLGLSSMELAEPAWVEALAGNRLLPGMVPYASCYGGHQFGHWAGQLGDGRAITLGELVAPGGARHELQLKGAGPTPYSRSADGRAVMRSSVREFLCSEAMAHLGVPTTRALSLVATGEAVVRDVMYSGDPRPEPGAIVCRVAPTFLRFGHFELPSSRKDHALLRALVEHTIARHFPRLLGVTTAQREAAPIGEDVLEAWLAEVARRTAQTVVHWMRVGFVHGVMNTDNMSILGLTIDYGPYGWLEGYDPDWTPNTTDAQGRRYRFGHQLQVAWWNLVALAQALVPLFTTTAPVERALEAFHATVERDEPAMLAAKLGLEAFDRAPGSGDAPLLEELFALLGATETDLTLAFRGLADVRLDAARGLDDATLCAPLAEAYYAPAEVDDGLRARTARWLRAYAARVSREGTPDAVRRERMNAVNPKYVLRNYLAQLAIDGAEQGDGTGVRDLLEVLRRPYDDQPGMERYAEKRPEWARHRVGCSMLSCSS
jgi:uncharacterized protein YdiU (UPF0061 family)